MRKYTVEYTNKDNNRVSLKYDTFEKAVEMFHTLLGNHNGSVSIISDQPDKTYSKTLTTKNKL